MRLSEEELKLAIADLRDTYHIPAANLGVVEDHIDSLTSDLAERDREIERLKKSVQMKDVAIDAANEVFDGLLAGLAAEPSFTDEMMQRLLANLPSHKTSESLRAQLSASQAACAVLREHYQKYAALVESERPDMDECSLDECIKSQHSALDDLLQAFHSLPTEAARYAEQHKRMREYIAQDLKDYYSYGADVILPCLERGELEEWQFKREYREYHSVPKWIIAAQDALNLALPSAGELHQESQGK